MKTLVCCLEEPSAWEMLKVVLPKILPEDVILKSMIFEGKQDLEQRLTHRIRLWRQPNSLFLVLRDQDAESCSIVKERMMDKVDRSGKSQATIIRIACRELETFYLGDLEAVERGLGLSGMAARQNGKKFRSPDQTQNPKQELRQITRQRYQPIAGSRAIAGHLDLTGANRSRSFSVLLSGVARLANLES